MTTLLFIRHAETDLAGTLCGRTDPPVNESGQKQISALIADLRGKHLKAVVTSDLLRARTTAEAIAEELGLPTTVEADLSEIDFGSWDGLLWKQVEQLDPDLASRWIKEYPNVSPPHGEPFEDFKCRVLAAVSRVQAKFDNEHIAVITHGGVMRIVLQELCGKSGEDAWALTRTYCCSFSCSLTNASCGIRR